MKNLIKENDTINHRPLKIDNIQIQHRYSLLKSLFKKNNAFYIFSEPDFALIHNKKISWNTDLVNKPESYVELSEEEKKRINTVLKKQLKILYNRALYIYENDPDNKNIFETVDKAIEIPNLSDIYIIPENNKLIIVLTNWGAISDEYNAERGLIKKLVPIKVKDLIFNVKYKNGSTAIGEELFFRLNDRTTSSKSNENGKIIYFDLPFWQKIDVWYNDSNHNKIYNNTFECNSINEYDIILPRKTQYYDMKVIVLDMENNPVKEKSFSISHNNKTLSYTTDNKGSVILQNIEEGQGINCKIIDIDNKENTFNFINSGKESYNIKIKNKKCTIIQKEEPKLVKEQKTKPIPIPMPVIKPTLVKKASPIKTPDPIPTTQTKILNVINYKNKAVNSAKVFFQGSLKYFKTNEQGKLFFDSEENTLINLLIKKGNLKVESEIFVTNASEYTVKIPKKKIIWIYWLLPFLILASLLIYYFLFYISNEDKYTHKVFISGHIISDEYQPSAYSIAFEEDLYSAIVDKEGVFNLASSFPHVIDYTLDGFAIGKETRLILYTQKDCNGDVVFDTIGPLIINCKKWENNLDYNGPNTKKFKEPLQNVFSQEKRIWSIDTLEKYHNGSIKVIFEKNEKN